MLRTMYLALLLCVLLPLSAFELYPDTMQTVHDGAQVLSPASESRISNWLDSLQQQAQVQIKVATWKDLAGQDLFTVCQEQYDVWKLDSIAKDEGAIIALSLDPDARGVRIHTGYGLEATLPDSWCGSTARAAVDRYFRSGRHEAGLLALVSSVVQKVAEERGVQLSNVPPGRMTPSDRAPISGTLAMLFLLFALILITNRMRYGSWWLAFIMLSSTRGSGGWSSSGGGFRGGGGFGGGFRGGGGMSGGGGGGASW